MSFRVLHVLKRFRPDFTGEGIFLERLTPVMNVIDAEVEHDVLAVVTPRPRAAVAIPGSLQRIYYLTAGAASRVWNEWKLIGWMAMHLHRYHVVHIHTHVDRHFTSYLLAKLYGTRLIMSATLDDSAPGLLATYRARWRPVVKPLFRLIDHFVAISPKLQGENEAMLGGKSQLIPLGIIIPPPQDFAKRALARQRLGYDPDDLVLIFVGGICDRKDPAFLVEMLRQLRRFCPRVKLLLVGPILEPDYHRRILSFIAANDLSELVTFTGEVRNPYPLYEIADVMTFASRLEGFGTVVIEAMAHGLPVVARHLPGVNDKFIEPDRTGFLFDEARGFVEIMRRLAQDAHLRERIGAAARAHVSANFSMPVIAETYLRLYGRTISQPSRSAERGIAHPAISMGADTSIFDRRFWRDVHLPTDDKPVLLTLIDAEEDFDWSKPFSRDSSDVSSMAQQALAHRVFEKYGVIPSYLVDYCVVNDPDGYLPLVDFVRDGKCEIGAQLHPWVTPPFLEEVNTRNSFLRNLPVELQHDKMRILTERIVEAFGVRPRMHRTGRFGAGRRTGDILMQLGYTIDCSVVPHFDFSGEGGPRYGEVYPEAYWIDANQSLLEIPVTCGLVGRLHGLENRVTPDLFSKTAERFAIPPFLSRTGLLDRIKLTPEGISIVEARRLVRTLLGDGRRIFTVTYHSTSLNPGSAPYVRTARDLDAFLAWLDEFYAFFFGEIGGVPSTGQSLYARVTGKQVEYEPA